MQNKISLQNPGNAENGDNAQLYFNNGEDPINNDFVSGTGLVIPDSEVQSA